MKLIDIDKRQRIDVESPRPERKGLKRLLPPLPRQRTRCRKTPP